LVRSEDHNAGNSPASEDLYEESVLLVRATDLETAAGRGAQLAEALRCEYDNVHGEVVSWRVERVLDPCEIGDDEPADGTEVYSRFYYLRDGREVSPRELPD
jgi:hypothetical protein